MNVPENLQYTENHEWVLLKDDMAIVGVTDYAQGELGDVVYVDVDKIGQALNVGDVFGSVEAVKTVSDLFMPLTGEVIALNENLEDDPELVNKDPYGAGWMIKIAIADVAQIDELLDSEAYKEVVGA